MPSESQAQAGLMALASTQYGQRKLRAEGKKPPPISVAREFRRTDAGRAISKLARHVRKRK